MQLKYRYIHCSCKKTRIKHDLRFKSKRVTVIRRKRKPLMNLDATLKNRGDEGTTRHITFKYNSMPQTIRTVHSVKLYVLLAVNVWKNWCLESVCVAYSKETAS